MNYIYFKTIFQNFSYEKSGFKSYYTHDRFNGKVLHSPENSISHTKRIENEIIDQVVEFDEQFFPDDRKIFIRNWIKGEGTTGIVFLDQDTSEDNDPKIMGSIIL